MRISDWSSDVCSSDLAGRPGSASRGNPSGMGHDGADDGRMGIPIHSHARHRCRPAEHAPDRSDRGPGGSWRGCRTAEHLHSTARSEERRVGKEVVSTGRSRWAPSLYKKKLIHISTKLLTKQ